MSVLYIGDSVKNLKCADTWEASKGNLQVERELQLARTLQELITHYSVAMRTFRESHDELINSIGPNSLSSKKENASAQMHVLTIPTACQDSTVTTKLTPSFPGIPASHCNKFKESPTFCGFAQNPYEKVRKIHPKKKKSKQRKKRERKSQSGRS